MISSLRILSTSLVNMSGLFLGRSLQEMLTVHSNQDMN